MIEYIKGEISDLTPTYCVLETNGIGYMLNISLVTYQELQGQSAVRLYVYENIREDAHVLYGFLTKAERELFLLLISVSGVGAATARMILSSFTVEELQEIIATGNVNAIKSVKGIGLKSAQRIIVDLKDKVLKLQELLLDEQQKQLPLQQALQLADVEKEKAVHQALKEAGVRAEIEKKTAVDAAIKDEQEKAAREKSEAVDVAKKDTAVKKDADLPFEIENIHLAGEHNRHDVLYAFTAASKFGVSAESAKKAIDDYEGIEHRMENIGTYNGITFYNDCIATIPHAVMCAINAINASTLIIGGKDRGIDYTDFAVDLENSDLTVIIGTKSTGHKIIDMMIANGTSKTLIKSENLEEAVKSAYENTKKDGVCILSPAASSYNEYKNFEEKGRHYKELVKKYGE